MIRFVLLSALLFFMHSALAEDESGEMKTSGGFVNMEPDTDYDAPIPDRPPAGDEDADEGPDEGADAPDHG